jgi:hypothetical protein
MGFFVLISRSIQIPLYPKAIASRIMPARKAQAPHISAFKKACQVLLLSMMAGAGYCLICFSFNIYLLCAGILVSLLPGLLYCFFEFYIFGSHFKRQTLVFMLCAKTFAYTLIVSLALVCVYFLAALNFLSYGEQVSFTDVHYLEWMEPPRLMAILLFSLVGSFLLQFFSMLVRLSGPARFQYLLAARYHKPVKEVRTFVQVSFVADKALANGTVEQAIPFYKETAFATGSLCEEYGGMLHTSEPERNLLSWPVKNGIADPRVRLFAAELQTRADGLTAQGKLFIAIHQGPVTMVEAGSQNREILVLGPVLHELELMSEESIKTGQSLSFSGSVI